MAKVTAYIPEPAEYEAENQRQIIEALATMQQQQFSFQQDLKNEQEAFNYFLAWYFL